ncbi:MAG: 16S rRNA (uracil(1498)-N(3))-methyltransferase [Deltaproteobacteria bacterium]|nr:16S rRNA (uracil(1498)-N(3))-methyltransferase [Deltaproteobacteria bacterium]
MNLLLVDPGEVADDVVVLDGRRAAHLRTVLGVTVGTQVRVGIIGAGTGTAEILTDDGVALTVRLAITAPTPRAMPVDLVLAVPRPKALTRTIEAIASFAVARVALTNAWRVDKSYLTSPRLAPAALAEAARLGAEQGMTTHIPEITIHHRLMELLDARWPAGVRDDRVRMIAHPGGIPIEHAMRIHDDDPITLAIGPEGGWIEREIETFVARGFTAVSLGAPILRVETAVAAVLGQLVLLRRLAER